MKNTILTKDGVKVAKGSNKYKGHVFYDEKGVGYKCLGFFPEIDDCMYKNLSTGNEVIGCMKGFYFNNPVKKEHGGSAKYEKGGTMRLFSRYYKLIYDNGLAIGTYLMDGSKIIGYAEKDKKLFVETSSGNQIPYNKVKVDESRVFKKGGEIDEDNKYKHTYMMLGRLQMDCEYFINNMGRYDTDEHIKKHLWAGSVDEQIKEMKKLWNSLPIKPEWLSMEEILVYESKMKNGAKMAKGGSIQLESFEITAPIEKEKVLVEFIHDRKINKYKRTNNGKTVTYSFNLSDMSSVEDFKGMSMKYGFKFEKGGHITANDVAVGTWLENKKTHTKVKVWNVDPSLNRMQLEDIYGNRDNMWRAMTDWKVISKPVKELREIQEVQKGQKVDYSFDYKGYTAKVKSVDSDSNYNLGLSVFRKGEKSPLWGRIIKEGATKAEIQDAIDFYNSRKKIEENVSKMFKSSEGDDVFGKGGNVYSEAQRWWGNDLSLNEQKQFAKKHLLSFQYEELLGDTAKYSTAKRYDEFVNEIWEKEGKPISKIKGLYDKGGSISEWEKQSEWHGNPSLGFDSYRKYFANPFNRKKVPVFIFGKDKKWSFVVSAGAGSDYSYTGGFSESPTIKQAMAIVDALYENNRLIYAKGGNLGDFLKGTTVKAKNGEYWKPFEYEIGGL